MNKKLPFEDLFKKKIDELPTGNEDAAWQKMKKLLDDKDRRKPFVWLNLYTVCGCIILVTLFSIYISLSNNISKGKSISEAEQNSKTGNDQKQQIKKSQTSGSQQSNKTDNIKPDAKESNTTLIDRGTNDQTVLDKSLNNLNKKEPAIKHQDSSYTNSTTNKKTLELNGENSASLNSKNNQINLHIPDESNSSGLNNLVDSNKNPQILATTNKNDTAIQTISLNSLKQFSNVDSDGNKNKANILFKPKKQFFIEAGIQIKQQIPLAGQKLVAYNYKGDKKLIGDYAPSVFMKFQKNNSWFFKSEFNCATPYSVKQFAYDQKTVADYGASTISIIKNSLQKVYYNQIPVSFNYYIKPAWSVGVGLSYNWFLGAVSEQETILNDFKSGTQTMSKQNIYFKDFTDSFLYKSTSSLFFQTGYSLKRWSFALQFSKNLQPFLKYTLPDGTIADKRNASLNLLIGYSFYKRHCIKIKK